MAPSSFAALLSRKSLRSIIFYEYRLGSSERAAARRINLLIGQGTVSHMTVHRWFQRFKSGNFSLEDEAHSGRPPTFDEGRLKKSIEKDPRQTTRCLAEEFKCHHSTIETHLHSLGFIRKYAVWIPHSLSPHQLRMSKPAEFYKRGIHKLPERWQRIVDNNGQYISD
ncbi:unnamed protein product [Cylicostephanus goldi]|uniref:Mos1 transposase HTH domain-containing protein n=1 Tax=Cylicostephanus goldi TaxID=71465 RepID=A0A3P7MYG9_CYLGO|nr:unnamed protein product [Cylicostephanus goldi]